MSHRPIARLSLLSLCLATAFATQAQTPAKPKEEQEARKKLESVIVTGQAANLRGALDAQQAAQGIVSVVHADGIGQLPDNNAAEALARLPGVSIERDQGEGRFVRVRGLGPDLNGVSINGSAVPAAEADRRAVGLDVVPAGLIRSLEVSKTLTPEQDANSLGGHVAVKTLSAFDQPGRFFSLEAGANYDGNSGKTRPRAAATFADRFLDGKLGLALALSHDERAFGSDNVETGGAWDLDGSTAKLEELERRKYSITRQRQGAALNLDWRPDGQNGGQSYYLRMFSSRFSDDEQRQAQGVEFEDAQAEGESGDAEVTRALKARKETARIASLTLGGERRFGDWLASAALGGGQASESTPDGLAGAAFVKDVAGVGFGGGSRKPLLTGPAALADAAGYSLDDIEMETSQARDRERNARFDLQHEGRLAGMDLELKFGAKTSRRTKTNEQETWVFKAKDLAKAPLNLTKAQLAMGQFLDGTAVDYPWGTFGPALSASALRSLVAPLDRSKFREEEDSRVNDFRIEEQVDAAYLQAKLELSDKTQLLGGLRHERLSMTAQGTGINEGEFESVAVTTRSHHWLPALLVRHELGQDTLVRAALTHSLVRPSFGQLAPGFVIDGDEAEFGNPALKPLRSRNLDLGIERRLARDGAVSAYVFHKRIRDFVYRTDLAGTGKWTDFDSALTYANGEAAKLSGLELSYNQALRMLPGPWNGLILGANATLVHSSASVSGFKDGQPQSRRLALPSQSKRSVNLSLGWEGRGFGTRLALNHKSAYLLEVGDVLDAAKDQWVDAQTQVDFSLRYDISPKLAISFEALNLNDSKYYVYAGRRALNSQYEQYGRSYKIGLKLAIF